MQHLRTRSLVTINAQIAALLDAMAELPSIDFATVTPGAMRALTVPMQVGPPPVVEGVRDIQLDLPGRNIAARLYLPEGSGEPMPLVLYYHGGGWVICSLETHDALCRALARESGIAVLSIDYRLAPETPFPGPLDDCYDALTWACAHAGDLGIDANRIAVAGDSAGGNLAAAVAIRARDENGPALRHQLLIYPVTDIDFETASYREHGGDKSFLSTSMMQWFWRHYLGDGGDGDVSPLAAPLRHSRLAGLPPATIIVAEYDVLRDEGLAYGAALRAAGVAVETETAHGMIHGFFNMLEAVPDGFPYLSRAAARLRSALTSAG